MTTFEERAEALVKQMTPEEKALLLRYPSPAIPRLGIPEYNWWNEALHGVARAGTATVFPQAIALAAMFDDSFLFEIAKVISTEGRAKYNMHSALGDRDMYKGLTFWSPNVNIFRDPRWGRGQETYGEDPYLTSRLGVAFVKGIQGEGKYLKAAACAKHFAAHSGPEAGRHSFDSKVSKKDLYETYLPAFKALVREAHVEAVMGAYNRLNGVPCCGSYELLTKILREDWGFEGHVVSDCWAIRDFHTTHGVTATAADSAAMALKAGCDLNCGNVYLSILQALGEGLITEEDIDTAATRLVTTLLKLGMLGDETPYDSITFDMCDCDEHAALALAAARKSMVLLKNDNVLPLDIGALKSVAVIGPNADSQACLEGNYNGNSSRHVTFLEGIRSACEEAGVRVRYSVGCHLYKDSAIALTQPGDRLSEAKAMCAMSDATIVCLGFDAMMEGEEGDTGNEFASGDKDTLMLPKSQITLMEALSGMGKPLIVVVSTGSAMNVPYGDALIHAWYPGQAGGTALADIIFGKVSPSGRLPVTFYERIEDLPPYEDYDMKGRTYRYFEGKPLYPFGFGLSYADFEYADARWSRGEMRVRVTNLSDIEAEDVAQVYVKKPDCPLDVKNVSLCAFARVRLSPGESREISLPLSEGAYTAINEEGAEAPAGKRFVFYVGSSQPDAVSVEKLGRAPLRLDIELPD